MLFSLLYLTSAASWEPGVVRRTRGTSSYWCFGTKVRCCGGR
jgi:hypothetical protein